MIIIGFVFALELELPTATDGNAFVFVLLFAADVVEKEGTADDDPEADEDEVNDVTAAKSAAGGRADIASFKVWHVQLQSHAHSGAINGRLQSSRRCASSSTAIMACVLDESKCI